MKEAGFTWAFPAYFKSLMVENMTVLDSNKMAKVLWRRLILAMMWSIWMERDARIFEGKKKRRPWTIMKRRNSLLLCCPQMDKPFDCELCCSVITRSMRKQILILYQGKQLGRVAYWFAVYLLWIIWSVFSQRVLACDIYSSYGVSSPCRQAIFARNKCYR